MRVAIINYSGNVGKTVIAMQLLQPRMKDAQIYSIETINEGASAENIEVREMKGRQFLNLSQLLVLHEDSIVDIGASNVETLFARMKAQRRSHELFDKFIVPVVQERKIITDSLNTIKDLIKIGVNEKKINVIFNKVEEPEDVKEEFASIIGPAHELGCRYSTKCVIEYNEVYEHLHEISMTLSDLAADETDYRQAVRDEEKMEDKEKAARMMALQGLAVGAKENLDAVYDWLVRND